MSPLPDVQLFSVFDLFYWDLHYWESLRCPGPSRSGPWSEVDEIMEISTPRPSSLVRDRSSLGNGWSGTRRVESKGPRDTRRPSPAGSPRRPGCSVSKSTTSFDPRGEVHESRSCLRGEVRIVIQTTDLDPAVRRGKGRVRGRDLLGLVRVRPWSGLRSRSRRGLLSPDAVRPVEGRSLCERRVLGEEGYGPRESGGSDEPLEGPSGPGPPAPLSVKKVSYKYSPTPSSTVLRLSDGLFITRFFRVSEGEDERLTRPRDDVRVPPPYPSKGRGRRRGLHGEHGFCHRRGPTSCRSGDPVRHSSLRTFGTVFRSHVLTLPPRDSARYSSRETHLTGLKSIRPGTRWHCYGTSPISLTHGKSVLLPPVGNGPVFLRRTKKDSATKAVSTP